VVAVVEPVLSCTFDEPQPTTTHATINSTARHIGTKLTGALGPGGNQTGRLLMISGVFATGRPRAAMRSRKGSEEMAMASKKTKAPSRARGRSVAARRPMLRRATLRAARSAAKMIIRRRLRKQVRPLGDVARTVGDIAFVLVVHGPELAQEIGLIEPPKRRRALPILAIVVAVGAAVAYLLRSGRE
jgi:hypothetical protein